MRSGAAQATTWPPGWMSNWPNGTAWASPGGPFSTRTTMCWRAARALPSPAQRSRINCWFHRRCWANRSAMPISTGITTGTLTKALISVPTSVSGNSTRRGIPGSPILFLRRMEPPSSAFPTMNSMRTLTLTCGRRRRITRDPGIISPFRRAGNWPASPPTTALIFLRPAPTARYRIPAGAMISPTRNRWRRLMPFSTPSLVSF